MSDSEVLQDISDDLRYLIKSTVPNSVYKNESDPDPGGGGDAPIYVNVIYGDSTTLDKTCGELYELMQNGSNVVVIDAYESDWENYTSYLKVNGAKYTESASLTPGEIEAWTYEFSCQSASFSNSSAVSKADADSLYPQQS